MQQARKDLKRYYVKYTEGKQIWNENLCDHTG